MTTKHLGAALLAMTACAAPLLAQDAGFVTLFNGKDLAGWKIPPGDNGHWKVIDGVIDIDAESESKAEDKSLWTEREFGDFVLRVDWRLKDTPYTNPNVHIVKPDGTSKLDAHGKPILMAVPDSDSGIFLRGEAKSQVNIWCWPVGSGEVYGYRTDDKMPAAVRAAVTPKRLADHDIGEWNTFEITMKGTRLTVVLNGERVIDAAELPGVPARGRIALQHHGGKKDGQWIAPPALVQFRRIAIKE